MIKAFVILGLVSIALAQMCTQTNTGAMFCNSDMSWSVCTGAVGAGTRMSCATGTACQCGSNQPCFSPCTTIPVTAPACETGSSPAQPFCQARINNFSGAQAYFCNTDATGFYQCARDTSCNGQASPRSQLIACPTGTHCACSSTTQQCSGTNMNESPCVGAGSSQCTLSSFAFPGTYVSVSYPSLSVSGTSNNSPFSLVQNADGTVSFSTQNAGNTYYLSMNGQSCNNNFAGSGCGTVGVNTYIGVNERFNIQQYPSGHVALTSSSQPNVYLRIAGSLIDTQYWTALPADSTSIYEILNLIC